MNGYEVDPPHRPFRVGSEDENSQDLPDKDHINDQPASDEFVTTGEELLDNDNDDPD